MSYPRSALVLGAVAAFLIAGGPRQDEADADADRPPRHPNDWVSPDTLAAAVYAIVSGPAGQERDWDRYRALFRDGALFMTFRHDDRKRAVTAFGVEEYVEWYGGAFNERGIWEEEVFSRTERFGGIAHRWSTGADRGSDLRPAVGKTAGKQLWRYRIRLQSASPQRR